MAGLRGTSATQSPSATIKPVIAPVVPKPSPPVETRDEKKLAPPKVDPEITALIEQLADQDAIKRTEAINKLRDADAKATPALEAAAKNENYDISSRAAKLLEVRKLAPLVKKIVDAAQIYRTLEFKSVTLLAEALFGNQAELHSVWRGLSDGSRYVNATKLLSNNMIIENKSVRNADGIFTQFGPTSDSPEVEGVTHLNGERDKTPEKEEQGLKGITLSVISLFDFTHVREVEIDGEPLLELTGVVREDFLKPETRTMLRETLGASMLDSMTAMRKAVIRVSRIDHLLRSGEVVNEADQLLASMVISDLKTDLEFSSDAFDYTPPKGVKVTTLTRNLNGKAGTKRGAAENKSKTEGANQIPAAK
jgi:hypothetical protein